MEEITRRTVEAANKIGLQINQKKRMLMRIGAHKSRERNGIRGRGLIWVFSVMLTGKYEELTVNHLIESKYLARSIKVGIHKTIN